MYELSDEQRQDLMRLALMIVCGGTAILPFTVPPTSPIARAQTVARGSLIALPEIPGRLDYPAIEIERDPFVADKTALPPDVHAGPGVSHGTDEIGIVLPPNAGAAGVTSPATAGSVPIVRGIVLGDVPQALVEFGESIKVVSVGDHIGTDTVRSIDAGGITLSGGLRLPIASAPR